MPTLKLQGCPLCPDVLANGHVEQSWDGAARQQMSGQSRDPGKTPDCCPDPDWEPGAPVGLGTRPWLWVVWRCLVLSGCPGQAPAVTPERSMSLQEPGWWWTGSRRPASS